MDDPLVTILDGNFEKMETNSTRSWATRQMDCIDLDLSFFVLICPISAYHFLQMIFKYSH